MVPELGDYVLFAAPGSPPEHEQLCVGRVDEVDRESGRVLVALHDSQRNARLPARIFEPVLVDLVSGDRVITSRMAGRPNFEVVYARLAAKDLRAGPFQLSPNGTLPPEIVEEWS